MARVKHTMRRSGQRRTTLRIDYHLTRDDLIGALASHASVFGADEELAAGKVIEVAKERLKSEGQDVTWTWSEGVHDPDEAKAWAERQVEKVWPA